MRTTKVAKRGFVPNELSIVLLLLSLAAIFIMGNAFTRVFIVTAVTAFVLFAYWYDWKIRLRPGTEWKLSGALTAVQRAPCIKIIIRSMSSEFV